MSDWHDVERARQERNEDLAGICFHAIGAADYFDAQPERDFTERKAAAFDELIAKVRAALEPETA